MAAETTRLPYGEWPARNARMGDIALVRAVLAVKGIDGDHAVLIGACPIGNHQGSHECSADAGGYHLSFRGSVFDERPEAPGYVRVWVRSDGDISAEPLAAERK